MVHSVNMNTPSQDTMITEDEKVAKKIAWKSSINVIPLAPSNKVVSYPIPEELKMAIELDKNDSRLSKAATEYSKIISCLREFRDIKPNHYWFLMKLLIYLDHYQCMADMAQYSLYRQKLTLSKYNKNNLVIYVPGLAEDRPSVKNRDMVIIRETDGDNHAASMVTYVGEKYLTTKVDIGFITKFKEGQEYNVFFLYPEYCMNCMHYAVDRATKFDLLPMLFPTGRPMHKLQPQQHLLWINQNIRTNPEQQQAVRQILARSAFPAPYILFGPPGTGKTSTLVEAIGQILRKNPSNRILVCTPSNAAADEVALRLLKNHIDGREMHRMYSVSRDCKDIGDSLKPFSNFADDTAIYISKEILITKKVVITTLITCHRLITYKLRENHFSYVFVDEAGQATEPETLIPLTLMSSKHDSHKGRLHGQLVIAGDPKQLGPSTTSRIAEPLLGRSMLERLMEWDLYRKDESNGFNPSYVTKLVQNYRCHPAILHVPNVLFYDGELKACGGSHTLRATTWRKLPKPNFPVIFHAVEGEEERDPRSPSVFNSEEVSAVISYVKDLLHSSLGGTDVLQTEIGIVTPYRLQRQKIHEELKKNGWPDVSVGTVETFQGQERDIIIMSTVRSVLYKHNGRIHIGFLSNPKRFNVALTRAKALLIVVGNPVVLQIDQYWRSFITFCVENRACRGSDFLLQRYMSHERMRKLMARKHVPINNWNPDEPFEVVEEEPAPKKTFRLPERSTTRRRRVPRYPFSNDATVSDEDYCDGSEVSFDENGFDLGRYINGEDEDYPSWECENEEDEYEMMELFLNDSLPASDSPPDNNAAAPKHPENSWDTASSTTTTDQSDKSPDCTEDSDEKPTVSKLTAMMPNLKISDEKPTVSKLTAMMPNLKISDKRKGC